MNSALRFLGVIGLGFCLVYTATTLPYDIDDKLFVGARAQGLPRASTYAGSAITVYGNGTARFDWPRIEVCAAAGDTLCVAVLQARREGCR